MNKYFNALLVCFLAFFAGIAIGATIDVSQHNYCTNDNAYDRNPSIISDGSNYWLFYTKGDNVSTDGVRGPTYNPDADNYVVYYKTASTIDGLAGASETKLALSESGRPNGFDQRVVSAAAFNGKVYAFVSSGQSGTDKGLYYYEHNGSTWSGPATLIADATARGGHINVTADAARVYLVWESEDGTSDCYTWNGITLSSKIDINDGNEPKIVYYEQAKAGNLFVTNIEDGTGDIEVFIALASPNPLFGHHSTAIIGGGFYDPCIFTDGIDLYVVSAPYVAVDRQYLVQAMFDVATSTWSGSKVVSYGGYGGTEWWDYWPCGYHDGTNAYLFFATESGGPIFSDGEIAFTKMDWDLGNDHYFYIQNAADQANAGDTVMIADGLYIISNTTVVNSIAVMGESREGVIIAPSGEDVGTGTSDFNGSYQYGFMVASDNVVIENLTIDGRANNIANGGSLPDHNNFRSGVASYNASSNGFDNLQVKNVDVRYTRNHGISLGYYGGMVNGGHVVSGCNIEYVEYRRAISSYASHVTITGNTISDVGMGIYQSPSPALPPASGLVTTISGNTLTNIGGFASMYYGHDWPSVGIYFRNPNYDASLTVAGNNLTIGSGVEAAGMVGVTGMYIYNTDANSLIENNTINALNGTDNWGIYLGGCAGTTVRHNEFLLNDSDRGIYLGRGDGNVANVIPNTISFNTFTSTGSISDTLAGGTAIVMSDVGSIFWMVEDPSNTNNIIADNKIFGFIRGVLLHYTGVYEVKATLSGNDFSGNSLYGLDNTANIVTVDASGNWWGSTDPAVVTTKINGNVDYTPWLGGGVETYPGFQGDYSILWVDENSPQTGAAGYIEEGIDLVSGSTVNVMAGTYREQLYIDNSLNLIGSGLETCVLEAPDVIDRTTYSITQWTGSVKTIDAIIGVNSAGTVNISGFTVDGRDLGPDNFYGVHFFNTSGSVTQSVIDNITNAANPANSNVVSLVATHGLGETFSVDFSDLSIPVFQKGGIVIMGPGATFTVNENHVTNVPSPVIAGNGIQLSYGATGTTYQNIVEGAGYMGADWAATGILLFESGNVAMNGDEVYNCESGINFSDWGWIYDLPTAVILNFTNLNLHDNEWTLGAQLSRDNCDPTITITGCDILSSTGDGIDIWGTGLDPWGGSYYTGWDNGDLNVTIDDCNIRNSALDGIWTADFSGNTNIVNNFTVFHCDFTDNIGSAINNTFSHSIDATRCFWDAVSGPVVGTLSGSQRTVAAMPNPFGADLPETCDPIQTKSTANKAVGETIYGPVLYDPWCSDETHTNCELTYPISEAWVDDDWAGSDDGEVVSGHIYGYDAFDKIQEAVQVIAVSGTVNVAAGIYAEAILIDKSLTMLGATAGINKNGYAVPADYAWDDNIESIIVHPNPNIAYNAIVDIYDINDVVFEGFVVQELNAVGNNNTSLVRVYAFSHPISNISVINNIIGPNTNTVSQNGTHGRMGLYIVNHPYSDYGVTNSTFAGNKIFDCKGNGNNIFIWSSYYAYGAPGPASMNGTVIDDNEIYGSHRSGIETAGGFSDLTISDNTIYGNSGLPGDNPNMLKYGHGILLIRGSSDKLSGPLAFGPVDLTVEGNEIYGNEKSGIYLDPKNDGLTFTDNIIHDNGWNGIMVDLVGNYWNPTFEDPPVSGQFACYDCSNDISASGNSIYNNGLAGNPLAVFGVQVNGAPTNAFVFDAEGNWWGAYCGPYHPTANPDGIGNAVSDYVDFDPWCNDDFTNCAFSASNPAPPEVWVDDNYAIGLTNDGHLWCIDAFAAIQDGVEAVADGGIVHVAAGVYREQVKIESKDLDLMGSGLGASVIEAVDVVDRTTYQITQWNTSIKIIDACVGVVDADEVNISGFTVDGRDLGPANFYGICYFNTSGSITGCRIEDISYSASPGTSSIVSVFAAHGDGITVDFEFSSNEILNFQKGGFVTMGPGINVIATNNVITGFMNPNLAPNGIQVSYGSSGILTGNTVTGVGYPGNDWAGTCMLLFECGDVTVTGGEVTGCQIGIGHSQWNWIFTPTATPTIIVDDVDMNENQWSVSTHLGNNGVNLNLEVKNCVINNSLHTGVDLWGSDIDQWGGGYYAGWTNGTLNANIHDNHITNSSGDAIDEYIELITGNAVNCTAIHNDYSGYTNYGVYNNFSNMVDATECYWGSSAGPITAVGGNREGEFTKVLSIPFTPGKNDLPKDASVVIKPVVEDNLILDGVTTNVDYSPWWGGNYVSAVHTSPWNFYVDNSNSSTIMEGIELTLEGDTVFATPAIYQGAGNKNIDFGGKNIVLAASGAVDNTIIDCQLSGRGLYFHNGETEAAAVIGFTLKNGNSAGNGGAILCANASSPTIANCLIIGNIVNGYGGGIACDGVSNATIVNCTISKNTANAPGNSGGGIYCFDSSPVVKNTIVYENYGAGQNQIYNYTITDYEPAVIYCDVQYGWPGSGNWDVDPLFRNPDLNDPDFHLMAMACGDPDDSPCIDIGHPNIKDAILTCANGLGTILSDLGAYGGGNEQLGLLYYPGDVNMSEGNWPPLVISGDVTYLVNFFRGIETSSSCLLEGFWCSGDANGDCNIIGGDVTYLVNFFRGLADLKYCLDYPPAWLTPGDLPTEMPFGWPNCETTPLSSKATKSNKSAE